MQCKYKLVIHFFPLLHIHLAYSLFACKVLFPLQVMAIWISFPCRSSSPNILGSSSCLLFDTEKPHNTQKADLASHLKSSIRLKYLFLISFEHVRISWSLDFNIYFFQWHVMAEDADEMSTSVSNMINTYLAKKVTNCSHSVINEFSRRTRSRDGEEIVSLEVIIKVFNANIWQLLISNVQLTKSIFNSRH